MGALAISDLIGLRERGERGNLNLVLDLQKQADIIVWISRCGSMLLGRMGQGN